MQVWDRDIILTALADYYDKDSALLLQELQRNLTHVINIPIFPLITINIVYNFFFFSSLFSYEVSIFVGNLEQ